MTLRARLRILRDTGTWIIPDRLLACSYPRRPHLQRVLAAHGITTVINLHTRSHPAPYRDTSGLHEIHLPVLDFTPPTPDQLAEGVRAIHDALAHGERVAVHCGAGLGRTGTLLACYLVSTGLPPDAAIKEIRRLRPGSIETPTQEAAIHTYAETLSSV